jgi:D-aminopeptidase
VVGRAPEPFGISRVHGDELLALQPNAPTVAVKRLAGKASTLSLSHAEAKRQIREAAAAAVTHIKDYQPWKIAGPSK